MFQQDNEPKHTSDVVKKWFHQAGMKVLDWSPQSPDLDPSRTCGLMKKEVRDRKMTNLVELHHFCPEESKMNQKNGTDEETDKFNQILTFLLVYL